MVPVCKYIPGKNSPPRFVVLVPQEEELDDHKVQLTPPGFHVMFLPFADDFRKVPWEDNAPRGNNLGTCHHRPAQFQERKFVNIFLSINFNISFGCSKESSQ